MLSRLLTLLCCTLLCSQTLLSQNKLEIFAGGNLSALSVSTDAQHGGDFPYYQYRLKSYGNFGSGGFQVGMRRSFTLSNDCIFLSAGLAYSNQRQVLRFKEVIRSGELEMAIADRVDYLALPMRAGINLGELSFHGGLTAYYALARKFTETTPREQLSINTFDDSWKASLIENTGKINRFRAALAANVRYQFSAFPRLGVELQYEKHLIPFWQTTAFGETRTGSNIQLNLSYALRQNNEQAEVGGAGSNLILVTGLAFQPNANLGEYATDPINYASALVGINKRWPLGKGQLETGIQYQERKFITHGPGPVIYAGGNKGDGFQVTRNQNLISHILYLSVPVLYNQPVSDKVTARAGITLHTALRKTKTHKANLQQPLSLHPALSGGMGYQLSPTVAIAFMADQFVRKVTLERDYQHYPLQLSLQTEISL